MVDRAPIAWRHIALVTMLGVASGLPLMLTTATMQIWLADQLPQVAVASLGAISLLGLPYVLKGLWTPYVDRYRISTRLAHREGWIALMQVWMGLGFIIMAYLGVDHAYALVSLALLITVASATQDSALDAHRIEKTQRADYAIATSGYQLGFRLAMMLTGGGALMLADHLGWANVYYGFGVLCWLIALWVVLIGRRPKGGRAVIIDHTPWLQVLISCFNIHYVGSALMLVMALKVSDAVISNMAQVFFLKALRLSLSDIGFLYKVVGLACTVLGSVIAGISLRYFSLKQNIYVMACLQVLAILPFVFCAFPGNVPFSYVVLAVVAESFTAGMIGSACIMLLMLLCQKKFVATQYACLVLFALLPRILLGAPAGLWVDQYGWLSFFVASSVLAGLPFVCFATPRVGMLLHRLGEKKG